MKSTLRALAIAGCTAAVLTPALASEDIFDGNWHFQAAPYVWAPDVNASGTLNSPDGGIRSLTADLGPGDYLENLDFAAFVRGEARKGRWSVSTDYSYFRFSGDKSGVKNVTLPPGMKVPVSAEGSFELEAHVWSLVGGYTVWHGDQGFFDLVAGTRLLDAHSDIDYSFSVPVAPAPFEGEASSNHSKWNAIGGVKGMLRFGKSRWTMPYAADIGTGPDNWCYNVMAGIGPEFSWGQVVLGYRRLVYKFDDDRLDMTVGGPGL